MGENQESPDKIKSVAHWAAIGCMAVGAVMAFWLVFSNLVSDPSLFRALLAEHVRAIVGIPMAAISAYCIVMVLEATSGTIEFKALGFEFRGASGPVVLWIFAFLAFSAAIRFLW